MSSASAAASAPVPTALLSMAGQSIWVDNITRPMLDGPLQKLIAQWSVVGLTSNPTIFAKAIAGSADYDAPIAAMAARGMKEEEIFFTLAIEDLTRACELFAGVHARTGGVDGWCSLEVSPLLAYDARSTVEQAVALHARAGRPNLYIKVPGTPQGVPAIEELVFRGIPVNVTLLFSTEQYLAAAEAYLRGLERRAQAGKELRVEGVASLFISRWDTAVDPKVPADLKARTGLAVGADAYAAYTALYSGERWLRLEERGARPQRLLFASTGTKDPALAPAYYVEGLAAPRTVNTMPEATLQALHAGGRIAGVLPPDGGPARAALARIRAAGVDLAATAATLQKQGAEAFEKSWHDLLADIRTKSGALAAR
ncbi:MAG: transaldolase [Phycisphaerales bacterium]